MGELNNEENVPQQTKGSHTDVSSKISFDTEDEAIENYKIAKEKLLNISRWHTYSGKGTADFMLTDSDGNPVSGLSKEGDFFRINIPGPGSTTGDGFDWVQIQHIQESNDHDSTIKRINKTLILVKPAPNPTNTDEHTAHFFTKDASSTFLVMRNGKELSAKVHGRNELANTDQESLIDKARNLLVATGAVLGFSEIQWKSLTEGLINKNVR